ncbi:hypothetical protein GCM10027037_33650 [Mucilaginibacter koreensis]
MKINQFTRNAAVILAIAIGLYPVLYLLVDMHTNGLLASKPKELLNDLLWNVMFYTHISTGGLALLTGWPQFNLKRRRRNIGQHRILGRIYLIAVAMSSITGLYVAFFATGGLISAYGFSALALAWLFTAALAYTYIRRGQVEPHRRWMIMNYSLTFAAVTLRLWLPLLIAPGHMQFTDAYHIVAWLCWVPNLICAWWIARPKRVKPKLQVA